MTERRVDPFTGRSVVIAPGRRGIGAAKPGGLPSFDGRCPFCPGHESDTERTIAAWPSEDAWRVRVVPNKYPLPGTHEVVIEARDHDVDFPDLAADHVAAILRAYRDRMRALEPDAAAVVVFRNRGRRAGSSQPHPHAQIVALDWVPAEIALRWSVAEQHFARHGESVGVAALRRELEENVRIIAADDRFVVHCPYAPSRAFEVRLAPRECTGGFTSASDADLDQLAPLLVDATARLRRAMDLVDYNVIVRHPPARAAGGAAGWHIDVLPRSGGDAGFELATSEMIVVVTPEDAAERLRVS